MEASKILLRYVRAFSMQDYPLIAHWWKLHGSAIMRPEHLSQNGLVIGIEGKDVCAGFMYSTDSKMCALEFVVCDPNATKEHRDAALDKLLDAAETWASKHHFTLIYTSISIPKYIQRLQNHGFIKTDMNQTHLWKEVSCLTQ